MGVPKNNGNGEWPKRPTHGMVYIRKKKKTSPNQTGWWDDKKKLEAVTTYLATGNAEMTSAIINVPSATIRQWKMSDWWKKYTEDLQYEDDIQINSKLEKIMNKSLDAVMDRLENGDVMYDPRTGKQIRIPAKLRDVQKVTNDVIDKRQLLRKASRPHEQKTEQVTADHLVQLAQAFAQFANSKEQPREQIDVIDMEVVDAISKEREKAV